MRLNLGSGGTPLDGYENLDRKTGQEIYPLPPIPGGCDEIRASHVLEHFSHTEIGEVLADWYKALKPGGVMRLAVPDFEYVARNYLAGQPIPTQGYVMGGHVDKDDRHGCIFDHDELFRAMRAAGLVGIQSWKSTVQDCASLPVSLNLMGYKPPTTWPKVQAVMSVPRLGFMDNFFCAHQLTSMGIELRKYSGAFWGQCLTRAMECALEDAPEFILTIDYDSIFSVADVQSLLLTMVQNQDIDALAPVQASRSKSTPLMTIKRNGKNVPQVDWDDFQKPTMPISTAHFGLTLIRTEKLKQLQAPWFHSMPDQDGGWGEGRTDEDIYFWRQWEDTGFSLHSANRVAIGHAELMIRWPGADLQATYQHPSEYWDTGKPEGSWK